MARTQRVSKYIGESKVVNGYTFTVVEVEKYRFMVEITQDGTDFTEIEVVSRGAWIKGVFSKIMKRLKPAHVGETQVINGVLFTIIEYAKGKFTAVAQGFDGLVKRGYDSWKKASFYKTAMAKDLVAKVKELGLIVLAITSQQKTNVDTNSDDLHDLKTVYNLRGLKKCYKSLAHQFHPDHGGNTNMFKLVKTIYDVRKKAIEMALDLFNEDDEDYKEIVDSGEEMIKGLEGIQD